LVKALTNPDKGSDGKAVTKSVADLHVAVITSSLGSHGALACSSKHANDKGHLLPRAGENGTTGYTVDSVGGTPQATGSCPAPIAASALTWAYDPTETANHHGTAQSADMQAGVACLVESAKEDGCGYEAQLESIYHFLIDPAPYDSADGVCDSTGCSKNISVTGLDGTLLQQRAAFLRPDSLLAVIMLTDENDFSGRPDGALLRVLATKETGLKHGTSACATVSDAFEPEGATDLAQLAGAGCRPCVDGDSDPACTGAWSSTGLDLDKMNLRGFQQVQRFGVNYLWNRQRYVDGFTETKVMGSDGKLAQNPIYAGGRSKDHVVVAGILGVPKNLVTAADGTPKAKLTEPEWDKIVSPDLSKRDPHMIESIGARPGLAVFGGARSVDPVHGGERVVTPKGWDLQYACIAPRNASVANDPAAATDTCYAADSATKDPLCGPAVGGKGTQPYFKAYPTLRELRVIHELSQKEIPALVASICDDSYAGAVKGITDALQNALSSQCLATVLDVDAETGAVPCQIMEVFATAAPSGATSCAAISSGKAGYCTPGAAPCRSGGANDPVLSAETVAEQLQLRVRTVDAQGVTHDERVAAVAEADGNVYVTGADGKKHLVCEMMQLAGNAGVDATTQDKCRTDASFSMPEGQGGGWCYSREDAIVGAECKKRGAIGNVRFFGDVKLHSGSDVFTVCLNG
jgi:hypothetical protein